MDITCGTDRGLNWTEHIRHSRDSYGMINICIYLYICMLYIYTSMGMKLYLYVYMNIYIKTY
jgi:hypothetical protein